MQLASLSSCAKSAKGRGREADGDSVKHAEGDGLVVLAVWNNQDVVRMEHPSSSRCTVTYMIFYVRRYDI